ncbi:hypothetical protein J7T55_013945 [Diaporthe amygdali]|uniref:uncharacterized protein n=1 Tax=Phomopsis amygdali TaxID=1214568 RepID=UPI0022FEBB0A|nr:uncharacterized protein J7T55_013945 [Diaporthe amygdali]KAJ0119741.1 hypothetical protein J7T55_013945 [Diaporthe amygdali]
MSNTGYYYYFIDATCDIRTRNATRSNRCFDFFVRTAQHWARRAVERLQDNSDTDFARVFNVIFKTQKDDSTPLPRSRRWQDRFRFQEERDWIATIDHVTTVLSDFGNNWQRTDNRQEANLRFFSDNRKRWLDGGQDPMSQQDRCYDPVNHVWYTGNVDALNHGQAVGFDGIPGSQQFPDFDPDTEQHARQENPRRYVIDISNNAWNNICDWDLVLGSRGANFNDVTINDIISGSMARIIIHEVMHCFPYYLDDVSLQFSDGAYETSSWEAVMNCKKGDAHRNAESIALLGLWAALADTIPRGSTNGGFTLDRGWDSGHGRTPKMILTRTSSTKKNGE